MVAEFGLNDKMCFIDQTRVIVQDLAIIGVPELYNSKVKKAIAALEEQLPTFAVIDEGLKENERLCLLVERGSFWGMGYLPDTLQLNNTEAIKSFLTPLADNDYIRNNIYSFAETYPHKKFDLNVRAKM